MIRREIRKTRDVKDFDFFNDYKDTRSYLVGYGGEEDLIAALDAAEVAWSKQYVADFLKSLDVNILREICRKAGVQYHHHDKFDEPRYKDDEYLKNAVVVVYPGQYDKWCLAINADSSIVMPADTLQEAVNQLHGLKDSLLKDLKKLKLRKS